MYRAYHTIFDRRSYLDSTPHRSKIRAFPASTLAHTLQFHENAMTELSKDEILKPYRKFRTAVVRRALFTTAILAAGVYQLVDKNAAHGLLLGGLGGILGFWIIAVRLEKLANMAPGKVHFAALTGTLIRFLLYGAVLFRAFTLDRENMHGLIGATAGILVIRFVTIIMAITGSQMPIVTSSSSEDASGEQHDVEEHHE